MDWLGLPSLVSVSDQGAVQGRRGEMRYSHNPHKLSWKFEDSPTVEHSISADCIIGLIPVGQHLNDDYSLLYVEDDLASAEEHAIEKICFRALVLTNPPINLITDYSPSGQSCWAIRQDHELAANLKSQVDRGVNPLNVILSVKSGQGHAESVYLNLLKPFLDHIGCANHTVHRTTSDQSISKLCRDTFLPAARRGVLKIIVLLSGDGGVVDLVNGLLPYSNADGIEEQYLPNLPEQFAKPNCALLPLGTGNALAHSSGVTGDRTMGMSTMLRGYPVNLPMFTVRFTPPARVVNPPSEQDVKGSLSTHAEHVAATYGAVVFSWALHAALVADSDTAAYRAHGVQRFQMAAKENLFPADGGATHQYKGKLTFQRANGEWKEVPRDRHSYILATLCSRLEEKFTISPWSRPLDGKLRLVHFGPNASAANTMTGQDIVGLMQKAYDGGKHVQEGAVGYEEAEQVRLEMDEAEDAPADEEHGGPGRWRRVCVDGKIFLCDAGATIEVLGPKHTPSVARMVRCPD